MQDAQMKQKLTKLFNHNDKTILASRCKLLQISGHHTCYVRHNFLYLM